MSYMKNWCFTSFKKEAPKFDDTLMNYLVYQNEICPKTGNEHWQGFVQFKIKKRMSSLKDIIDEKGHYEKMRGTARQASDYCKKTETSNGKYVEHGEIILERQRSDLKCASKSAMERKFKEIEPEVYVKYYRGLHALANLHDEPKFRPELKVIWLWGESGAGKSYLAHSLIPEAYVKPAGPWFDGYNGEKAVIIDELDNENETQLLKWLDIYKLKVPVKGGFVSWNPTLIIITSIKSPDSWWSKGTRELSRRITITQEVTEKNRDGLKVNYLESKIFA